MWLNGTNTMFIVVMALLAAYVLAFGIIPAIAISFIAQKNKQKAAADAPLPELDSLK